MSPESVILVLKVAVAAVTGLLLLSLVALAARKPRWHGRINMVFFALTAITVLGFEAFIRLVNPELTAAFSDAQREALAVHLAFSVPAAILLPFMLYTGLRHYKTAHYLMAAVFLVLWTGTFVTGIFFLPHSFDPSP